MQSAAWASRQNPLGTGDGTQYYLNGEREHREKFRLAMFIISYTLES